MNPVVIINPRAGTGGPALARARAQLAAGLLEAHGFGGAVIVTERPGHAHELARRAVAGGAVLVIAWGGDGTVNEVGSALAFGPAALGIVPAGSGNGLARELRIHRKPERAMALALTGAERTIDAGELGGRLFFNVAGIGFDAEVAARFNAREASRRGLLSYLTVTVRTLFSYAPRDYTVTVDGHPVRRRAMLVAIANSRQYGNGMTIAPGARVDDGRLDLVMVEERTPWRALWEMRHVVRGTVDRVAGVDIRPVEQATIAADGLIAFHVDGEMASAAGTVTARVHPRALRVRVAR